MGFEVLNNSLEASKAVVWNRYEVLWFVPNQEALDDEFSYMVEGFSETTLKSKMVQTVSAMANTLSGEDYFIYGNNIEDTYFEDLNSSIFCIIPSFTPYHLIIWK